MESKRSLKQQIAEQENTIRRKDAYIAELKTKLENEAKDKSEKIEAKDKEILALKKQLSGEHICSGYCSVCAHSIMERDFLGISYICDLDAHCKDFKRCEANNAAPK